MLATVSTGRTCYTVMSHIYILSEDYIILTVKSNYLLDQFTFPYRQLIVIIQCRYTHVFCSNFCLNLCRCCLLRRMQCSVVVFYIEL